ncbi:MAG: hypothetical protein PVG71_13395 [Anaerolineae bacterium]|jgi:uncharacterized protein YdeI (YjbR/CyaY-like superfamily)
MRESPEYLEFSDRNQWRTWLEQHHAQENETWLVHYKRRIEKIVEEVLGE